jgi:mRNA-degrading endonuclease toxin of MazEF toxin-antitoxin module
MNRSEIWLADLGYQGKIRPILILSVPPGPKERALVSYVIRTTSARDTAYEIPHHAPGMKPGVFDAQGIGTTDKSHLIRKLGMIDAVTLAQVEAAVKAWLGFVV